jgi:hypothetical protein
MAVAELASEGRRGVILSLPTKRVLAPEKHPLADICCGSLHQPEDIPYIPNGLLGIGGSEGWRGLRHSVNIGLNILNDLMLGKTV